jgi:hypothetical protein
MNKIKGLSVLLCFGLSLVCIQALWAQRVSVTIHGTDNSPGHADSVVVGNDPAATNHIDAGLGEEELPVETLTYDFRSVDVTTLGGTARADTCLAGLALNLHHQSLPSQSDRWRLQFKADSAGTNMHFSWQAGLASVGGGGWFLEDGSPDIDTGAHFQPIDMTTQTSFDYPVFSLAKQYVYIHTFDAAVMRSIQPESLALSPDLSNPKGAKITGKGIKRKAWQSDWCMTFVNHTGRTMDSLFVKFDQALVNDASGFAGFSPFTQTTSADPANVRKQKSWLFTGGAVADGQTVTICGKGWGGKGNKAGYSWMTAGGVKVKNTDGDAKGVLISSILRLPMPNYWNMVEELYGQSAFPVDPVTLKPLGVTAGYHGPAGQIAGKDYFKNVYHPKSGDLFKTLYDKKAVNFVHTGAPRCLNTMDKDGKDILKAQKSLPPTKHNNVLLAEVCALKVGIAASDFFKTPHGFGDLVYVGGGPLNNRTIRQIAVACDTVLSCDLSNQDATPAEAYAAVHAINVAFSGAFDTSSFGSGSKSPPPAGGFGATILTGVRSISAQSVVIRGADNQPATLPSYAKPFNPEAPTKFELSQNYPNPFNPTTTIEFTLNEDAFVTLKIYDILGQEVATLLDREQLTSGANDVDFNASNMSSGVYYYRISVENVNDDGLVTGQTLTQVKKMMLLK